MDHHHDFRVVKMCEVLGVSKSGYYKWRKRPKSPQKKKREELTKEVRRVYNESKGRYGSPKINAKLKDEGFSTSKRTVQRIMKKEGIRSITSKKYKIMTTDSNHRFDIYPNLLDQQFTTTAPAQVWTSDITYVWTSEGWVYLASVMDLFSRKVIGFHMSHRLTKDLAITALQRAMSNQTPQEGLIHHSDRGSQYASKEYISLLNEANIRVSMSRKGNCYDNACSESFHSIIKKELIYQHKYQTRDEAMLSIFQYIISDYNQTRIHSTLGYVSPNTFEKRYYRQNDSV
jgi:putative transposase